MAIKALYYFLSIFFIVVIALVAQDPYSVDLHENKNEIATIEFLDVQDYLINKDGIKIKISAQRVEHYSDKNILYDIDGLMNKNKTIETLKAKIGTLKEDIIYLNGDVIYTKDNKIILKSSALEYHEKSATVIGRVPFTLDDDGFIGSGNSFVYDTKNGLIKVQNIIANIEVEDK